MSDQGRQVAKVAKLMAGGAVIGSLLARWLDQVVTTRAEERSEHDRTRYARGLSPIQPEQPHE